VKHNLKLFLLAAIMLLFVTDMFCQVVIDTLNNTVTLPTIQFPKDGDLTWYYSKEGMAAIIGILTVLAHYLANLFPAFRKLKLDAPLKAIGIGIGVTVIFATIKGMPLVGTLLTFIFSSVSFWSQSIYSIVGKPVLGSSNDVAAAVAKSAVEDPNVPYPEQGATELDPSLDEKKN